MIAFMTTELGKHKPNATSVANIVPKLTFVLPFTIKHMNEQNVSQYFLFQYFSQWECNFNRHSISFDTELIWISDAFYSAIFFTPICVAAPESQAMVSAYWPSWQTLASYSLICTNAYLMCHVVDRKLLYVTIFVPLCRIEFSSRLWIGREDFTVKHQLTEFFLMERFAIPKA